ncbi:hypothetical protein AXF42_Ash019261 [Apostasia shenzhenica]|uniref:Uncharacterized protein n=1 Tax=Apostasia shenzhenica TaxID=1088818 RepID=A0A2I0A325_9ASPA|nr:hypothetical protein AXF42_Ash019261 [Apostasia shenzhenica]
MEMSRFGSTITFSIEKYDDAKAKERRHNTINAQTFQKSNLMCQLCKCKRQQMHFVKLFLVNMMTLGPWT